MEALLVENETTVTVVEAAPPEAKDVQETAAVEV